MGLICSIFDIKNIKTIFFNKSSDKKIKINTINVTKNINIPYFKIYKIFNKYNYCKFSNIFI